MTVVPPASRAPASPSQLLATGLGLQAEAVTALLCGAASAPNTQTVWAVLTPIRGGLTVTGIVNRCAVAAAGTNPTTVRYGLADKTGKMLVVSGNYGTGGTNNATTIFAAGANRVPFTAPLVVPADDVYLACYVVNGTWGTTQPTPILAANAGSAAFIADGAFPPPLVSWAAQTDLPAVGASLTLTTGSTRAYYMALY